MSRKATNLLKVLDGHPETNRHWVNWLIDLIFYTNLTFPMTILPLGSSDMGKALGELGLTFECLLYSKGH